jgi:hypothetical protein
LPANAAGAGASPIAEVEGAAAEDSDAPGAAPPAAGSGESVSARTAKPAANRSAKPPSEAMSTRRRREGTPAGAIGSSA